MTEIQDDDPIPLAMAAKLFFGGALTKSSLRTEAAKGNLEVFRIANKDFVTKSGIKRMIERCRVPEKVVAPRVHSLFEQNHGVSAQQALSAMLAEQKKRR